MSDNVGIMEIVGVPKTAFWPKLSTPDIDDSVCSQWRTVIDLLHIFLKFPSYASANQFVSCTTVYHRHDHMVFNLLYTRDRVSVKHSPMTPPSYLYSTDKTFEGHVTTTN